MPTCPYCKRKVDRLTCLMYDAVVSYTYRLSSGHELDDIAEGSDKTYVCPYCDSEIAETEAGARRFLETGIPEIEIHEAPESLKRKWADALSKAVEGLEEVCEKKGYVLRIKRNDEGFVSEIELENRENGGYARFLEVDSVFFGEFGPIKSVDPNSQLSIRQAVLLDILTQELSLKGLKLSDISAAKKVAILLLAKQQVYMSWREQAKAARIALEHGLRLIATGGHVDEDCSRHAGCERFLKAYLEAFGREGLKEELVKAEAFRRPYFVKRLFPDNGLIFAKALEHDICDEDIDILEKCLSRTEPRVRAEILRLLAVKLVKLGQIRKESAEKLSGFLVKHFRSASDRELARVLGSILILPTAFREPEVVKAVKELFSRAFGARVVGVRHENTGVFICELEGGLEVEVRHRSPGDDYVVEVRTRENIIGLRGGKLVTASMPVDYVFSPQHVKATRCLVNGARQYCEKLLQLARKTLSEDVQLLTLAKLKSIAGSCTVLEAPTINIFIGSKNDLEKFPKIFGSIIEKALSEVRASLPASRKRVLMES